MIPLLRNNFFAILSGIALAISFPSLHCYYLAWVALVPLLWKSTSCTPCAAAKQFFVAAWIFHSIALSWLGVNVFWEGAIAFLGYQVLCIILSLFWAALGYLWTAALRRSYQVTGAVVFAALWVAMEWVQSWIFTGFGWCAVGYSQGPDPYLLQWAAIGGVGLVSFFVVLVNALVALIIVQRQCRLPRLVSLVSILVLVHAIGFLLYGKPDPNQDTLTAGLYQPNYPQELKFDPDYVEEMVGRAVQQSKILSTFEEVDLFVWPEALVVRHYENPKMMGMLQELTQSTGIPLFTGTVRIDYANQKHYNSAVLINPEGEVVDYYDKIHLAPLGEYLPYPDYLFFLKNIIPSMDAGTEQKVIPLKEGSIGPLICFEVLFAPMAKALRKKGADALVVVTNLAWFGRTSAIPQELEIARFRAVETRLSLIHAANTGISGVFDPWGRFRALDAWVDPAGRYGKKENETIDPSRTIGQRRIGALPVAGPVRWPIPGGPIPFPGIAILVALVYLLLSILMPGGFEKPLRTKTDPKEKEIPDGDDEDDQQQYDEDDEQQQYDDDDEEEDQPQHDDEDEVLL